MIYILIPVFNEEANIAPLAANIDAALKKMGEAYRLVFVNDGSTDGTAEVIRNYMEKYPLEMLENNPNQGVGISFDKGFKYFIAKGEANDILVTMEGDNTSDLNTLPKLIEAIRNGNDFALASVYSREGEVIGSTPLRLFFSFTANLLCRLIFKMRTVRTFSSFYRAYRHQTLEKLYADPAEPVITERGYTCMVEMLIKLHHAGFQFSEVPTTLDANKRMGLSKMKKRQTIKAYLRLFCKHLFPRISLATLNKPADPSVKKPNTL